MVGSLGLICRVSWSVEENQNRVGEVVRENNFGMIEVDWTQPDPEIHLQLFDVNKQHRVSHRVLLSELQPGS